MNRVVTLLVLCSLGVLVAGGPARAQDGVPSPIEAHLERIELYRTAARRQQAAIETCTRQGAEALAAYQRAATRQAGEGGEGEDLTVLDQACHTATQLMVHYLQKLIDTQQKLAAEHEALGLKYRGAEEFGLAEASFVAAGDAWESVAEGLATQAEQIARDGNLHDSGGAYERAAGFCAKAASCWQLALDCSRSLAAAAGDLTHGNRASTALATQRYMLRSAIKAYYHAYQQHKARGTSHPADLQSRQVGEAWLLAARSHEQYERLAQQLLTLPE